MKHSKRIVKTLVVQILFLVFVLSSAQAHKVRVFAYSEGKKIVGETAFSGGRSPKDSKITVQDAASGKILTTTKTNANGDFEFPIPVEASQNKLDLLIVVSAGEGHRGQWKMTADEYLEEPAPLSNDTNDSTPAAVQQISQNNVKNEGAQREAIAVDSAQLRKIINESLDRKLAPIKRMLTESKDQGPRIQDILGGIGYLIGLAGFLAYFNRNKNTGERNDA